MTPEVHRAAFRARVAASLERLPDGVARVLQDFDRPLTTQAFQVLKDAIAGLSPEQRQAFTLRYIFELGLADIA